MVLKATLVCTALLTAAPAFAQSSKSSDPPPADFKPLVQSFLPPLVLPPNSYISPGAITGDPVTPYSSTPGYDAARSGPAWRNSSTIAAVQVKRRPPRGAPVSGS